MFEADKACGVVESACVNSGMCVAAEGMERHMERHMVRYYTHEAVFLLAENAYLYVSRSDVHPSISVELPHGSYFPGWKRGYLAFLRGQQQQHAKT